MLHHIIGIDIAKDRLDAYRLADGAERSLPNTPAGCAALVAWIKKGGPVDRITFEATGAYHRDLERALGDAELPFAKLNARCVRDFARAIGMKAKTDRQDALLLARFGDMVKPQTQSAKPEDCIELQQLESARGLLIKERTALLASVKTQTVSFLIKMSNKRIAFIEKQITALDQELDTRLKASDQFSRKLEILCSIPGIAKISARSILLQMPELGSLTKKQVAALAGLAPFQRESGKLKGQSRIAGGRPYVRKALYMPAVSAIRYNPNIKAAYERLREKGRPNKVALTAAMRRLIVLANTLVRENRIWTVQAP